MFTIFKWTILYEQLKNLHILLYIIIILIYYVFFSPLRLLSWVCKILHNRFKYRKSEVYLHNENKVVRDRSTV